jgi:integrase/recombinase XerD
MMLADVIDAYLTRQRSLGMRFDSAGQLLHRFGREMGDRPIGEVTPGAIPALPRLATQRGTPQRTPRT